GTDAGFVVVPGCAVDGGALHVDRLQQEGAAAGRVDAVGVVGAHLGQRAAGRGDVVQGGGAQQLVVQRVDEAERVVRDLVGHRDHAGQQRRGQAGAADAVLVPVRAVGE